MSGDKASAVVFDMDDCIVNLREQVHRLFKKEHGDHIPDIKDWYTYNIMELFDIESFEEGFELFHQYQVLENARPERNAFDLIREYVNSDYRIFMVTARGWHNHGTVVTEQWLKDYNLIDFIDNFYITDIGECKSDVISRLHNDGYHIEHFFEDQTKNLVPCIDQGIVEKGYLVKRPWNKKAEEDYPEYFKSEKIQWIDI
jgi:hypothetical protein